MCYIYCVHVRHFQRFTLTWLYIIYYMRSKALSADNSTDLYFHPQALAHLHGISIISTHNISTHAVKWWKCSLLLMLFGTLNVCIVHGTYCACVYVCMYAFIAYRGGLKQANTLDPLHPREEWRLCKWGDFSYSKKVFFVHIVFV